MQNFRKLDVWVKAHQFVIKLNNTSKSFPKTETYVLTSQIRRSMISIPANIAEGCGKNSQRDFVRFLSISLGSTHETEYYLELAKDLGYLSLSIYNELNKDINEIKAMLIGLIAKVQVA